MEAFSHAQKTDTGDPEPWACHPIVNTLTAVRPIELLFKRAPKEVGSHPKVTCLVVFGDSQSTMRWRLQGEAQTAPDRLAAERYDGFLHQHGRQLDTLHLTTDRPTSNGRDWFEK